MPAFEHEQVVIRTGARVRAIEGTVHDLLESAVSQGVTPDHAARDDVRRRLRDARSRPSTMEV